MTPTRYMLGACEHTFSAERLQGVTNYKLS